MIGSPRELLNYYSKFLMTENSIQEIAQLYSIEGVSLLPVVGSERNGYYRRDSLWLVNFMLKEVVPIIGIDVYLLKNNKITISDAYDYWYCDRIKNETFSQYTQRSCADAIRYIENFNSKGAIPVFDITAFDFNFL